MDFESQREHYLQIMKETKEKFQKIEDEKSSKPIRFLSPEQLNSMDIVSLSDLYIGIVFDAEKLEVTVVPFIFNKDLTKIKVLTDKKIYQTKPIDEIAKLKKSYAKKLFVEKINSHYRTYMGVFVAVTEYKKLLKRDAKEYALSTADSRVCKHLMNDFLADNFDKNYNPKDPYIAKNRGATVCIKKSKEFFNLDYQIITRSAYRVDNGSDYYINLTELNDIFRTFNDYATAKFKHENAEYQLRKLNNEQIKLDKEKAKQVSDKSHEVREF